MWMYLLGQEVIEKIVLETSRQAESPKSKRGTLGWVRKQRGQVTRGGGRRERRVV